MKNKKFSLALSLSTFPLVVYFIELIWAIFFTYIIGETNNNLLIQIDNVFNTLLLVCPFFFMVIEIIAYFMGRSLRKDGNLNYRFIILISVIGIALTILLIVAIIISFLYAMSMGMQLANL